MTLLVMPVPALLLTPRLTAALTTAAAALLRFLQRTLQRLPCS
jgi:hypothetical protein